MYERLDANELLRTAERLEKRIRERFPDASLSKLASRLEAIIRESIVEVARLRKPNQLLRIGVALLLAAALAMLVFVASQLHIQYQVTSFPDLIQSVEATIGTLFFLSTGVFFCFRFEGRRKRDRTLRMIHKLRIVAHVVDMHQLTKSPDVLLGNVAPTASSPARHLNEPELRRYLNYSCELLAIVGKVAALYAEDLGDGVVLEAVDDLEGLTGSLINRIWQKVLVIGHLGEASRGPAPDERR
jgi:hypothetical protein